MAERVQLGASSRPLLRTALGAALRRNRQAQRRTLVDVARQATVSVPYLSEVERGRKEASSEVLAAVCDALRIALPDLLAEVGAGLTRPDTRGRARDDARGGLRDDARSRVRDDAGGRRRDGAHAAGQPGADRLERPAAPQAQVIALPAARRRRDAALPAGRRRRDAASPVRRPGEVVLLAA